MKLSNVKAALQHAEGVTFQLPDGSFVPEHFHITEVGITRKHFIDCGGTVRSERNANFQLWDANDYDHRLKPQKLLNIIALSQKKLGMEDLEVEVEYQSNGTIGKYGIDFDGQTFLLTGTQTACLANEKCGMPASVQKVARTNLQTQTTSCTPGGSCC